MSRTSSASSNQRNRLKEKRMKSKIDDATPVTSRFTFPKADEIRLMSDECSRKTGSEAPARGYRA
jgi:hypothetical protein